LCRSKLTYGGKERESSHTHQSKKRRAFSTIFLIFSLEGTQCTKLIKNKRWCIFSPGGV
jgi:hypothetical protein